MLLIQHGPRIFSWLFYALKFPSAWLIHLSFEKKNKTKIQFYVQMYVAEGKSLYYLTIRLWARDFYRVRVDEAEGRINYHA